MGLLCDQRMLEVAVSQAIEAMRGGADGGEGRRHDEGAWRMHPEVAWAAMQDVEAMHCALRYMEKETRPHYMKLRQLDRQGAFRPGPLFRRLLHT